MVSPDEIYRSVVRALKAETEPDPDPDSPVGADARLSSIATINPGIHTSGGFNRQHELPGIDVSIDEKERLDDGESTGEWTGNWRYEDGHPVGRIFAKRWRVTLLFEIWMWAGDEDHSITGLDADLDSVLNRFDTQLRGDFLRGDANEGLKVESFTDDGGRMGRGGTNMRAYEHTATIQFVEYIDEKDEYGPTPRVRNVLVPLSDEHHGVAGSTDVVQGDVPQERIDAEGTSGEPPE